MVEVGTLMDGEDMNTMHNQNKLIKLWKSVHDSFNGSADFEWLYESLEDLIWNSYKLPCPSDAALDYLKFKKLLVKLKSGEIKRPNFIDAMREMEPHRNERV